MNKVLNYQEAKQTLSLEEKIGQLFMPAAFINDTEEEICLLEGLIRAQHVGGLCFFHSRASAATNYEGKREVIYNEDSFTTLKALIDRYQRAAKYPLLIAIDAEWGLAMRIENTPQYPYAITLGAIQGNDGLLYQIGQNIAKDCKLAGIHWNLSPVVDINTNPDNPVIGYRSFGENRERVTQKALSYVKGSQNEGVLTSVKHFPGHGDTATDSHLGLPVINKSKKELIENELYPFQKLIDQGIDAIMVGHLSVPALANGHTTPSSISKEMIQGLLRREMGFKGVVISDALNMHAVSKNYPTKGELEWLAFDAGNDVLCFSEHTNEGISTILQNADPDRVEESYERVWRLKEKVISEIATSNSKLTDASGLNEKLARESLTRVKGSTADLRVFNATTFIGVENLHSNENVFFSEIGKHKKFPVHKLANGQIGDGENVLVALFPPQVKPAENFGFADGEITALNTLIKNNKVHLYLFGNPYILRLIDIEHTAAVVVAYQNFATFQEVAAGFFLGNFEAKGKLPVTIR